MLYINFNAMINEKTSQVLMNFLVEQVNRGEKELYFLFSSPGGSVVQGVVLHNFLRALPAKIIMHNIGIVDSMGNVVFLSSDERYASPHSFFLFHGVGFDIKEVIRIDEKYLRENLTSIKRDQEIIAGIIAERTKIEKVEAMRMLYEANVKTADEAKEAGIVQEVKLANIPEGSQIVSLQF